MHDEPMLEASYSEVELDAPGYPDVEICLAYWERLRGDRWAPPWHEFDWSEIPSNIIPCFGVVDVHPDPLDFVYRFWGSFHARVSQQELTGKSVKDMHPAAESRSVFEQYRETLEAKRPRLFANVVRVGKWSLEMNEVSLRLPFSNDGQAINQIVAFSDIRDDIVALEKAFARR